MTPRPRRKPTARTVVDLSELFLRAFDAGLVCASARHGRVPSLTGTPWKNLLRLGETLKESPSPAEGAIREHLADAIVEEFLQIAELEWDDLSVWITVMVDLQTLASMLAPWRYSPHLIETPTRDRK